MQGRELGYQILGLAARLTPAELPGRPGAWLAALTGGLPDLHLQHIRLMERHVFVPMLQTTPPGARRVPHPVELLRMVLPQMTCVHLVSTPHTHHARRRAGNVCALGTLPPVACNRGLLRSA